MDTTNYNSIIGVVKSQEEIKKIQSLMKRERKWSQKRIRLKVGDKLWALFASAKYDNFDEFEKDSILFLNDYNSGVKVEYPSKTLRYFFEACIIKINDVIVYDHSAERNRMEARVKSLAKNLIGEFFPKKQQKLLLKKAKAKYYTMTEPKSGMFIDSLLISLGQIIVQKSTVVRLKT